jgi:hypothetical protein
MPRPKGSLLEDRPRVAERHVEARYLYVREIGSCGTRCGNCRHKVRNIFFPRFYRSEEPQFSVIKQRKACNRHLSGYRKGIIFVTNQEASGRRDRTLCKQRVSRESGGKERLGLCTLKMLGPRGSYGTVLKFKPRANLCPFSSGTGYRNLGKVSTIYCPPSANEHLASRTVPRNGSPFQ